MSNVNLNFNNSNAISGFDNPGMIAPNKSVSIGGEPNSAGKAGWGHDTLPGLEKLTGEAAEQILSASKELATAYEDVMARIDQSTKDGAPSHVLDNLKRVASDILAGAKDLFSALDDPALVFKGKAGASDSVAAAAAAVLEGVQANMGELSKISKDPGIYFPDLSETAAPETKAEISADTKSSPDVESPASFYEEFRSTMPSTTAGMIRTTNAAADMASKAIQGTEGKQDTQNTTAPGGASGTVGSTEPDLNSPGTIDGRTTEEWMALAKNDPKAFGKALQKVKDNPELGPLIAEQVMTDMQDMIQMQNRIASALSNIMTAEHQTQKAIIQNFRV